MTRGEERWTTEAKTKYLHQLAFSPFVLEASQCANYLYITEHKWL